MANHTGYASDETHQLLGSMFLSYHRNGRSKEFIRSTTKLNTLEFENYLDKCRKWAWEEMSCYIPLPNELTEEMYMMLNNIFEPNT